MGPTIFFVAKKRDTKEKRKSFKSETIKRLSIKLLKNYQNVTVLASLERLEFKFSGRPTRVANNTFQCSMAPTL